MQNMLVHIMTLDKFNVPFMDFINLNFDTNKHEFVFLHSQKLEYGMTDEHNITWIDKYSKLILLEKQLYKSNKIIIHGLWSKKFLYLLVLQPWLLKKCYWVMWGGDFYFPEKQSWIKKQVIKRMGHFITYIKGDYELAQKWYGSNGQYHECFMYPSNLYKEYRLKQKENNTINIQLGNSADPTNNHMNLLQSLEKFKDENIQIFAPLSYGNEEYAKEVIAKGKELFEDKFIALTEFMAFEQYLEFLSKIDIALFAHKRQQAMGNTITLLGLGKKVYMSSDIASWQFFDNLNIQVFNVKNINLELVEEEVKKVNQQKIKNYFSEENLKKQLEKLLYE